TPAVNQIETHPFHQQIESTAFMKENNVQAEAWGPFAEGKNDMFHNETLASIGEKYNKSVAQVVLRWLTQRDIVTIPKTVRKERMEENLYVSIFPRKLIFKKIRPYSIRMLFSSPCIHSLFERMNTGGRLII